MTTEAKYSAKEILELISQIPDPEIPVITIRELGILREVNVKGNHVEVVITPTYSGCPAMKQIEEDIILKLKENRIENVTVKTVYHPAWTTDWITEETKEKLSNFGIAPPTKKQVKCPRCHSENTEQISQFGSTACKAIYRCNDCKEPFDYFKCH